MLENLPFIKYTAHGNNFVILDETRRPLLTEKKKRAFAWFASNMNYGIGCDNLLVIEKANHANMLKINEYMNYWPEIPDFSSSQYLFRMFEPDGTEAYSCGNGLMCIADYLYRIEGVIETRILTRIPSMQPLGVEIGKQENEQGTWVNLGIPQKPSDDLVLPQGAYPCTDTILGIKDVTIKFRSNDLRPFTDQSDLQIAGYIVFTGEPHLVIFVDSGFSISELNELIFIPPGGRLCDDGRKEKRHNFGGWLLHQIGMYLNKRRRDLFPNGINVNFARINKNRSTMIEFRTFERGINKETLSCGTGAVATAYIAKQLNLIQQTTLDLLPHKARWFDNTVRLRIQNTPTGWKINSVPKKIFQGDYHFATDHLMMVERKDSAIFFENDEPLVVPSF